MSEPTRRPRRWLQFGILDLLILTAIVAVLALLYRPAAMKSSMGKPAVWGVWMDDHSILWLSPDGYYEYVSRVNSCKGVGWTITRATESKDVFVLEFNDRRFTLRTEWGSGMMELLNDDPRLNLRLVQDLRLEGAMRDGKPHGTWTCNSRDPQLSFGPSFPLFFEYRDGELIDSHWSDGQPNSGGLEAIRSAHGLPALVQPDSSDERTPAEKRQ